MLSGETLSRFITIYYRRSQIVHGEWVVMGRNQSGFDMVIARCYYKIQAHNECIRLVERRRQYLRHLERTDATCHRSPDESSR